MMSTLSIPSLEDRVRMHLEDKTYTLYICPHAWALRRQITDRTTGETKRMRCGLWSCLYCGPRKVDQWRELIALAEPTLHLVLSKAGSTIEEAARSLTTFMQSLRRGSKGRGPSRVGVRPTYPVEYFGVLERHKNFEENGFHWHLLLKGVDEIPYKEVIQPLWHSARHGKAENGWIRRIDNTRAIGYVTKYLTKDITRFERGTKTIGREMIGLRLDASGRLVEERVMVQEEIESRARRIRYSRGFFPESTKTLRLRLFAEMGEQTGEDDGVASAPVLSSWELREVGPEIEGTASYRARLQEALTEVIDDRVADNRRLSRRIVSIWNYQRGQSSPRSLASSDED
jgi:hypothetical protein